MSRAHTPVASARHHSIARFAIAAGLTMVVPVAPAIGQTVQGTPAAVRAQDGPPLDTRTLSCEALKDRLQRTGALYVTARQGWAETFYSVPQCEFWAKPSFEYVNASDGACGLGYLCQWKPGAGSGR